MIGNRPLESTATPLLIFVYRDILSDHLTAPSGPEHEKREPQMIKYTACLSAIALSAGFANATDRYWIAPILGTWDTVSNWSLTDGGPAGGGLPQPGDSVLFTNRSTIIFTGPGPGLSDYELVRLRGAGSGSTQFFQSQGVLRTEAFQLGFGGSTRNEATILGGRLEADFVSVGFLGGENTLTIENDAVVDAYNINVGIGGGQGRLTISGGDVDITQMRVSDINIVGSPTGLGAVEITGGVVDASNGILLGVSGPGTLDLSGGELNIGSFLTVGLDDTLSTATVSGNAVLDVGNRLIIGTTENGRGKLVQTGGTITTGVLELGLETGSVGTAELNGGMFDMIDLQLGREPGATAMLEIGGTAVTVSAMAVIGETGDASLLLHSGSIDAATISVGEEADGELIINGGTATAIGVDVGSGSTGRAELHGGSFNAGTLNISAEDTGTGRVEITGGTHSVDLVRVGAVPDSDGTLDATGGVLDAGEIRVGQSGDGFVRVAGGTVETQMLSIGGVLTYDGYVVLNTGTLSADMISVRRDRFDVVGEQLFVREGLLLSNEIRIFDGGSVRFGIGFSFDARVSTIINDGRFDFTGQGSVLSGPVLFGNNRLLGDFFNNGDLDFRAGAPDTAFVMNLINSSDFDVPPAVRAIVGGAITNQPSGSVLVRRDTAADPGRLEARSTAGFTNAGSLELDNGIVATPNGLFTNNGTLAGWGEIEGVLINNAQILPSPDPQPQSRELIVDSYQGGPASSVRVLITADGHNSVVSTGATSLDGTINVAFAQGVPLPPRGTEYDLVVSPNETIVGSFANSTILGYPCEIINGRNRVFARTLRCNAADFVAPFGILDLSDINTFTAAFMSNNPLADINGDSFLDLADINAFVAAFTGGCP